MTDRLEILWQAYEDFQKQALNESIEAIGKPELFYTSFISPPQDAKPDGDPPEVFASHLFPPEVIKSRKITQGAFYEK